MLQAMSTGHAGSMSTVHAGSAEEALWRLETLALSGNQSASEDTIRRQLMAAIDLVAHVERRTEGRRLRSISVLEGGELQEVYRCP